MPCPVINSPTGNKIESIPDIAQEVNKYFSFVFNIDRNQIPQPIDSVDGKKQIRLFDVQFSEDDVRKKLTKLREDKAEIRWVSACIGPMVDIQGTGKRLQGRALGRLRQVVTSDLIKAFIYLRSTIDQQLY